MSNGFRKLTGLISPRLAKPLVCEACGNEFSCGASVRGCWCSEIDLSDQLRADLKSRYRDCLCRVCLERLANRNSLTRVVDNAR